MVAETTAGREGVERAAKESTCQQGIQTEEVQWPQQRQQQPGQGGVVLVVVLAPCALIAGGLVIVARVAPVLVTHLQHAAVQGSSESGSC